MKNLAIFKPSSFVMATAFALTIHVSYALADNLPESHQAGNITYVTGGIGDEERDALQAVQHNYNLRVLSAAGKSGEYPGDTHIVIFDKGGKELVDTNSDPLFYAELPAGHYRVEESSAGQTKKQAIVISANKPVNITFRWE